MLYVQVVYIKQPFRLQFLLLEENMSILSDDESQVKPEQIQLMSSNDIRHLISHYSQFYLYSRLVPSSSEVDMTMATMLPNTGSYHTGS